MKFKEQFPSLHLKTWIIELETEVKSGIICGQRSVLKGDDSGGFIKTSDVINNCIDKQKVKESIRKQIIGSNLVRSKVCEKPYGDTCGYCHKCNQNQELVINAIVKYLGIDVE